MSFVEATMISINDIVCVKEKGGVAYNEDRQSFRVSAETRG
jgi:hypothetical protein